MSKDGAKQLDRKAERAQKLAEALRDNLRRRKAAASHPAPIRATGPEHRQSAADEPTSGSAGDEK